MYWLLGTYIFLVDFYSFQNYILIWKKSDNTTWIIQQINEQHFYCNRNRFEVIVKLKHKKIQKNLLEKNKKSKFKIES